MRFVLNILKGGVIGIANIIPGVSGGTMAVSMGIYDQIIGSITKLFKQFGKSVKTLLPYAIGMVIGILGLSFFIEPLFDQFPMQTASAFVGLILGGLPMIMKKINLKKVGVSGVLLFVLFFALIIALQVWGQQEKGDIIITLSVLEVIKLFFIGVIASATMVIPGVSGSMILLSLGYYNPIIETINKCTKALSPFDFNALLQNGMILLPFGIGVIIGIFAIAKLIEFLLKKFEVKTYCAILGLIIASPFAIFLSIGFGTITALNIIVSIVTFALGFVIAYFLGRE